MKFREKIIVTNVVIVLAVLVFSLVFINIFVRQNFIQIIVGLPGRGMQVVIPEPGLRFLQRVRFILLVASAISLLIALVFAFFISSGITRPLKEMNKFARRIAQGDYQAKVDVKSEDEIGELANSLNYMADRLHDIETMRKTLMLNISHDLRTPLTNIKGYLELLQDETATKQEISESLATISNQVAKMERMVQELTDLSVIDGKQFKLNLERIDMVSVLKKLCEPYKVLAAQKAIEFREKYPASPVYIMGDTKRIEEIFSNLITNAMKFTQRGHISVNLFTDTNSAICEIEDTGIGIDENDLPHIFERFYRGDKARTNDNSGFGIGLAIVKELLFAHKGTISVQSKVGEGTKFTVRIPIAG